MPRKYPKTTRSRLAARRRTTAKGKSSTARSYAPRRHSASPLRSSFAPFAAVKRQVGKLLKKVRSPRLTPVHQTPVVARPPRSALSTARSPQSASSRPAYKPSPRRPSFWTSLTLDRKLDLLGWFLFLGVGFPTLLILLSTRQSGPTGSWISLLKSTFGWGVYIFPFTLMTIGLWLILRHFERVPQISAERIVGLLVLYFNLLASMHFVARAAWGDLRPGEGGGRLGGWMFEGLRSGLGWGGALLALAAWLLIALLLTLDISVNDLFRWIPPLVLRFQDWADELRNHREAPASSRAPAAAQTLSAGVPPAAAALPPSARLLSPADAAKSPAWVLPSIDQILEPGTEVAHDDEFDRQRARTIEETLASFGAPVNVVEINRGPTITQFGVEPDFVETRSGRTRVRVGKIASLVDDLALALSARTIRVQAPVPGKGYVGIEVPNEEIAVVALRDVVESEAFKRLKSTLRFAIGQDVAGNAVSAALDDMPHLLIAGATGSGKSVCVNALISCLLLHNTPDDLRLVMVDPKRVELTNYNGIPHLLTPVVVEMERVVGALQWVLREMDNRYHKLAQAGKRNITEYNASLTQPGGKKLPRLVVIVDELADLMMLAPDETERSVTRLAQLARATGIHLVIATQRPSVDVVTGLIKANVPARIAFAVASGVDSRVILDQPGAERLLGRGDMLFQAPDSPAPIRMQGSSVTEEEIQRLVQYWRDQAGAAEAAPMVTGGIVDAYPPGIPLKQIPLWEDMEPKENVDPLLDEAIDLARKQGRASITMLQRRLRIGYTRAARLIETMQVKHIIGDEAGPQGFEILDYGPAAPPIDES
jgi:S-DNA-T family DNA segregation ATPase FtsK/SpoIIIE